MKFQNKLETEFVKRYKNTDFSNTNGNIAYGLIKNIDVVNENEDPID